MSLPICQTCLNYSKMASSSLQGPMDGNPRRILCRIRTLRNSTFGDFQACSNRRRCWFQHSLVFWLWHRCFARMDLLSSMIYCYFKATSYSSTCAGKSNSISTKILEWGHLRYRLGSKCRWNHHQSFTSRCWLIYLIAYYVSDYEKPIFHHFWHNS